MSEPSGPLRVLLVEDSPDDADLVVRTLRRGGLDIEPRLVADEASFRAELASFSPELILADWALPGFSGTAAVRIAQAWDATIPSILVSGTLGEELVVEALRSGATDYVLKQRLEALSPAVRRALAEGAARREQVRMQAELAAAQATMRSSLDTMLDPFLICAASRDEDGTITGFRVVFANRAAEAFMGRMPDALTGTPAPDQMPYLGTSPFFDTFRHVVETGEAWAADGVDFVVPRSDGTRRSGMINIQVARSGDGFFATFQDVTERERVRRERELLATALDQAPDGVAIADPGGIFTYVNAAFLGERGLVRDDVVGRDSRVIGGAVLGPAGLGQVLEMVPTDLIRWREIDHTRPDGTLIHLEVAVTPVLDSAGLVTSYVVTSRDVTELRDVQAQLERRRALRRAVGELDRLLLRVTDPAEAAREACRVIVESGEVAMAWVALLHPETGQLVRMASHGDRGFLESVAALADGSPPGRDPAGEAVRTAAPVVMNDTSASPLGGPWRDAAEQHGYRSVAALPLRHGETTRGVVVAYGSRPGMFGPDEVAVIGQLASDLSLALTAIEEAERRRDLQAELAASERRFREALSDVAVMAVMIDSRGDVVFANRHFLDVTGWRESEVVGQDWYGKFLPPEDRPGRRAAYVGAIDRGTHIPRRRGRLMTRHGGVRKVEWSSAFLRDAGSIVGMVGVGHDVTERQAARAALEASEARLRTALDAMLDGVAFLSAVRAADGRIADFRLEYVNAAIGRLSRVAPADQLGHTLLELFPAHRTNGLFEEYVNVVETGVPFESGAIHYVDPEAAGGPLDQVLEHLAAKLDDGYVLSVRDVSERQAAEDEVRRLNTELEQRVRERTASLEAANRELETFSYSVSHDLRSPLRAMTGFAEILGRRYGERLDAKGRHYLDNIVEGGLRMGVLIEELLAYSRLGRDHVRAEPVPLGPILDHLRTTYAERISAGGGMLAVAEPLAVPLGDATLLEQVLANLLDNALTYRRPDVVPVVTVSAARRGASATVAVVDNGIGIPAEYLAKIFEPFVRLHTDDEYPGTGIGLATARKAARLMGGDISVESTPGVGTTFSLELKRAPARKLQS